MRLIPYGKGHHPCAVITNHEDVLGYVEAQFPCTRRVPHPGGPFVWGLYLSDGSVSTFEGGRDVLSTAMTLAKLLESKGLEIRKPSLR